MLKKKPISCNSFATWFPTSKFCTVFLYNEQFQSTTQSSQSVNVGKFTAEYGFKLIKISCYKLFLVWVGIWFKVWISTKMNSGTQFSVDVLRLFCHKVESVNVILSVIINIWNRSLTNFFDYQEKKQV